MLSTRSIGAAALCLCAGLTTTTNAEIFQRVQGDPARESAYSIWQTADGGYVTTGYRDPAAAAPAEDVLITKHFSDGKIDWQRLYRGPGRDIGYSVQQTRDGGYIVAAESTSAGAGLGILLIRLDAAGGFIWANYYSGDFMADPIHTPAPGVAVDQGLDGEFYVIGNRGGLPIALAVTPGGFPIWQAVYTDPAGPDGGANYAFTDVKVDETNGTVVISGTCVRPEFQQPGLPPVPVQDAFLMRITPGAFPIWSFAYDFPFDFDPSDGFNSAETGDGLDIGPNGDIILNGRTDFGSAATASGTHLVATDPAGMPTWSFEYLYTSADGVRLSPETAYAAVRFGRDLNIVQTGRVADLAGLTHAWESLTAFGGAPLWFWEYGGDFGSQGESVVPVEGDCGFAMAGRIFPDPAAGVFARGETYLVKNNDLGESGCLERRQEFFPEFVAEVKDAPIRPGFVQPWQPAPDLLDAADAVDRELCYDFDCVPGTPCPCDINMDGILDLADIGAFITCFTGALPCGDLNGDAIWDLVDIGIFVTCFTSGCP